MAWHGPIPDEGCETNIEIPGIACPITRDVYNTLKLLYTDNIILASDSHAVDVYINVRDYIYAHHH